MANLLIELCLGIFFSRTDYHLTKSAKGGEIFTFYIELACNGLFGNGGNVK
jgi:hypothetical protein